MILTMRFGLTLVHDELGPAVLVGNAVALRNNPGGSVRHCQVQHLALSHHRVEGTHQLAGWGRIVPKVDVKNLQAYLLAGRSLFR